MEFYISGTFRRMGFGRTLYNFMKQEFINYEAKNVWLTADKVSGEPFPFSIGFADTGELKNDQKVLVISI